MANNQTHKPAPKWADGKYIEAVFGINRVSLYRHLKLGHIVSASLKDPGCERGKRLFEVASVEKFLASRVEKRSA